MNKPKWANFVAISLQCNILIVKNADNMIPASLLITPDYTQASLQRVIFQPAVYFRRTFSVHHEKPTPFQRLVYLTFVWKFSSIMFNDFLWNLGNVAVVPVLNPVLQRVWERDRIWSQMFAGGYYVYPEGVGWGTGRGFDSNYLPVVRALTILLDFLTNLK